MTATLPHGSGRRLLNRALWGGLLVLAAHASLAAAEDTVDEPVQATLYAAPDGRGEKGSRDEPCSLEGARNLVRSMNASMSGNIVVLLKGGVYRLGRPFELEESETVHDSGSNGFRVIYRAAPGERPVLSGALRVRDWTLVDSAKNLYRASVPPETLSRQLFVNGQRAARARSTLRPPGWTKTETGWTVDDPATVAWAHPEDVEIVSRSSWKHLRCGVDSVRGAEVTMKMPGWKNASKSPKPGNPWNGGGTQQMNKVEWVENAFELLTQPGQWYLDRHAGSLFYIPQPWDEMGTADVELPVLERLLDVHGSAPERRIHHLSFVGIAFAHATWLLPSGNQGYADNQAGVLWAGDPPTPLKTGAALSIRYAADIAMERNVVRHVGGEGIDIGRASQRIELVGNCLDDVSGNGIFLGDIDDYQAAPSAWNRDYTVRDNYVSRAGAEFEDQVGIAAGYIRDLVLDHNEVCDLPYSGISVGWGWSRLGYSHHNTITHNEVHHFMKILEDGGGIYTLGNQGTAEEKTVWKGNYVHDGGHAQGLYADEGSGFMDLCENVVTRVGANWAYLWVKTIHDIAIHDNFSDKTNAVNKGTDCTIEGNDTALSSAHFPEEARAIIRNAGLEPAYSDIKQAVLPSPVETVDDADARIDYEGPWTASAGRVFGDLSGTVHFSPRDGAKAALSFVGKAVEYLGEINADEGDVQISIDGTPVRTVSCAAPQRRAAQTLFRQEWPSEGPHRIEVEKKSGGVILLDAFRIFHDLQPDP